MSTKGLLSREYVNKHYHLEWAFQYRVHVDGGDVQHLKKLDLESVSGRDQIKIWARSVRAFIQQKTDVVSVHMYLPEQVDRIIIFRFGESEPVFYAENLGDGINIFPGTYNFKMPENTYFWGIVTE